MVIIVIYFTIIYGFKIDDTNAFKNMQLKNRSKRNNTKIIWNI